MPWRHVIAVLGTGLLMCACSPSPEKQYSDSMAEIIPSLTEWGTAAQALDSRLIGGTYTQADGTEFLIGDFIFLWMNGGSYVWEDPRDEADRALLALQPDLGIVIDKGFDLRASIEGLTPPSEMQTYQAELIACMKAEIEKGKAIQDILATQSTSLNPDDHACDNWQSSFAQVEAFVNSHK